MSRDLDDALDWIALEAHAHCYDCTPETVTAALADGLAELLTDWRRGLEAGDAELLYWLAPRMVERARLAARAARRGVL